jgi:glycosyltransferase involved in cell wall biosynthesis
MEVSVIIPVYNAEAYVEQAVESALAQPETAEVLLVEDGSTDHSLEVCTRLSRRFPKVRLFTHPDGMNQGISASRNLGILKSNHEYIAFLDADDYYLPGRFTVAARILREQPLVDGVYALTGLIYDDRHAEVLRNCLPTSIRTKKVIGPSHGSASERLFETLLIGSNRHFHTSSVVVRRTLFQKTGLFDPTLSPREDTAMWIKMAAVGHMVAGQLDEPVAVYRLHSHNITLQHVQGPDPLVKKMNEVLIEWGNTKGLPEEQMELLFYRQWVDSLFDHDFSTRATLHPTTIWRTARLVPLLISRFVRHPGHLFSRHLFRFVSYNILRWWRSGF